MVSIRIFAVIFIVYSFTVNVKSQTCENTSQYGVCSSNSACGCFQMSFADNIGVCGLTGVSCSRLSSCLAGDTCSNADHICVQHPRCSPTPLCYPLSMVDQRLCPPMGTTVRTTLPFSTTQTVTASSFVTAETTGIMETTDYDSYNSTMDSFSPSGSIMSMYSGALTVNTNWDPNTNKYYQAIEILVNTSGYYDIRSLSAMDTYGCIFRGNYNPSDSSNQITCNDDYSDRQFRLLPFLEAGVSYSLLVSTYGAAVTGTYSIVAYGPGEMEFNLTETLQTSMATPLYFTSTYPYQFTSNYSDEFNSNDTDEFIPNYSDALTLNSGMFSRAGGSGSNFYYKAIQINVLTTGTYTFISRSKISQYIMDTTGTDTFTGQSATNERIMDTTGTYPGATGSYDNLGDMDAYGYIYLDTFNPNNPSMNLIQQDDDSGGNRQFRLTVGLLSGRTYVLVFTTFNGGTLGPFSIAASGPSEVTFHPIRHT